MKKSLYLYDESKHTLKCTSIEFDSFNQVSDYYSITIEDVVIIYDYLGDTRYKVAVDRMSKVWRRVIKDKTPLIIV